VTLAAVNGPVVFVVMTIACLLWYLVETRGQ
jgi:hypothetical protein